MISMKMMLVSMVVCNLNAFISDDDDDDDNVKDDSDDDDDDDKMMYLNKSTSTFVASL
jgi:hypothetical protein